MIEETYIAFRRALESMVLNTTCTCNACRNISSLDLKFFVHHAEFMRPSMGGHEELIGNDVNAAFRLTKNTITNDTGIRAYTAYTHEAVEALDIEAFALSLTKHVDTYPDVGQIEVFVQDMVPVWAKARERVRQHVTPQDAVLTFEFEAPLPPTQTWDYLSNPEYRAILMSVDSNSIERKNDGRINEGSVFVCAHGKRRTRHTIVDWRPFEEMTFEDSGLPGLKVYFTICLASAGSGTRVSVRFSKAHGSIVLRSLGTLFLKTVVKRGVDKGGAAFAAAMQRDIDAGVVAPQAQFLTPDASAIRAAARKSLSHERAQG
ncbi:MAG: DUF2652 domain-containing protein [Chloroflexi bacterium]|nr:DUF2652 domain-containing protein [Chloroflexota bacterium]